MRNLNRRDSFIDKYEKIVDLSIKEIEHIRSKYNWHVNLAATIVIIAIAVGYWLLSDHINGYKQILDNKFSEIRLSTETKQDSLNLLFIKETNQNIRNLVAKNFGEKEILKTIKSVTTEKVDSISNQYLDKLIEQKITPKLNSVLTKLNNSDSKIQLIEFYLSKVSALNDDRFSFDKLIEISKDQKNYYANYAKQVVEMLISRYSLPPIPSLHSILIVKGSKEFNWTFKQCQDLFFSYPKDGRITILDNVFELDRFTEAEKIKMALIALKSDESLSVVRRSSEFLINKFNLHFRNLEISEIINALKQKGYQ